MLIRNKGGIAETGETIVPYDSGAMLCCSVASRG